MTEPIRRRGEWWQERPDGGWLRWDEEAGRWQPEEFPPPPPETGEEPAQAVPPAGSTATYPSTGESAIADPAAPTPGYRYQRGATGEWWARNERTGELFWHDAAAGMWRRYERPETASPGSDAL